jgi:hypothetical protein
MYSECGRVVYGAGHKAKGLVLQCINGVSSNLRNMLYIIITAVIFITQQFLWYLMMKNSYSIYMYN